MARMKALTPRETVKAAFEKVADAIGIQNQDRRVILGGPEVQLDRMGMFLAIFELAGSLVGDASAWLNAPNQGTPFVGKSPLAFILKDPSKNLDSTVQYLRGAYGGWA